MNDVYEGENIVSSLRDMIYICFALIFLNETMPRLCLIQFQDLFGTENCTSFLG